MQLAFVYTLFNSLGVLFWLPIPFLRFPKTLARALGNIVLKYRWFLYIYVLTVYFIGPLFIFGLALIPMWIGLAIFGIPLILIFISILILKRKIKKIKCCCKKKSNLENFADQATHLENTHHSTSFSFSNAIRRLSAIEGLVNEGISYSRRNSLAIVDENDEEYLSIKEGLSKALPYKVFENELITRF